MARLNPWLAAVLAMLAPLAAALYASMRFSTADRLVALELVTSLCVLILTMMSFAFDQPSFVDLALALAFLSIPGTLVFTHFLERWL